MSADQPSPAVGLSDIEAAAARLAPVAVRTPLLESALLNDRLGGRLLVKAEVLQRTGSFKFRGAYNRISLIPVADRPGGVVAFSSGNHAQGVAAAARELGLKATIVMPSDAPAIKRRNTAAYGAAIVSYDRLTDDREAIAQRLVEASGATLVRPYDDPAIIAGQGTVGLEIAAQMGERPGGTAADAVPDAVADAVVVPASGGGLIAGCATALSAKFPGVALWSAEPAGHDDHARSLAAGRRLPNDGAAPSLADALLARMPGAITFEISRNLLRGGVAVTDAEMLDAMAVAFEVFKLVVEPGGAAALAAALTGRVPVAGRTVVAVCSGGNVDAELFRLALERRPA